MERVHDLPYFASEREADDLLRMFCDGNRPIILPEFREIQRELERLNSLHTITAFDLLSTYQRLLKSHSNTDIFCGYATSSGGVCGAKMDIEVCALGAFYQCSRDPSHRKAK